MAANLSSQLLLPVGFALSFAFALAAWPPSGSGDIPQEPVSGNSALETETPMEGALTRAEQYFALAAQYFAQEAKYRALLEEERRSHAEGEARRADLFRTVDQQMREATEELDRARAARGEALEEAARIQAEVEALRKAYKKATGK